MIGTVRFDSPVWGTLALGLIATPFFTRVFILFHDSTHGSPTSPRWNRVVGYLCGILTFTTFHDC